MTNISLKTISLFLSIAFSSAAFAKPAVTVARFEDKVEATPCAVHNEDVKNGLAREIMGILKDHQEVRVMNYERQKIRTGTQFWVMGTVRSFDQCQGKKSRHAKVAIEIRVVEARTGRLAFSFTSTANASGSASLDQTARVVLNNLAFRLERALLNRKTTVNFVSKRGRNVASRNYGRDYTVKLIRK